MSRARGLLVIVFAITVGVLGWVVLGLLAANLQKSPGHAERIGEFARGMIDRRGWILLAVLPAVAGGVWLARPRQAGRNGGRWAIAALCSLWLLVVFGLVLATFVQFIAPLYRYEPLG